MKRVEIYDYRKNIKEMLMKCLEEKTIEWKGYCIIEDPVNYFTGEPFRGRVRDKLRAEMDEHKWVDNRFMVSIPTSFKRLREKNIKCSFMDVGIGVYLDTIYYDIKENKGLTTEEYEEATKGMTYKDIEERFFIVSLKKRVRHISQIDGLRDKEIKQYTVNTDIKLDAFIERVAKVMDVKIIYDRWCMTTHDISKNEIHLPDPSFFKTAYDCNCAAFRELGQIIGYKLNKEWGIFFDERVKEELIVEVVSALMGVHLNNKPTEQDFQNQKAHVQSLSCNFEYKKDILLEAINEAENIVNYIERVVIG